LSNLFLARLPAGRHGLPREFVARNQRDRIAAGIVAAVAAHGYSETTISQIAEAAGVSRRTFYAYFPSKEECFLATYEMVLGHLADSSRAAAASEEEWPAAVRARLGAALDFFAANPDLARFCLIAPARAGEEVAAPYRRAVAAALEELKKGMPSSPAVRMPSQATQDSTLGGMIALLVRKVEAGEGDMLPELLPELLELFLAPYLGREEALHLSQRG